MPVAVNFPAGKKPFCRGRLLHVGEDATLLSVLRVALGDNVGGFAHASHLNSRDLTKQKTGAHVFNHIIVEHDQAELESKKLETTDSSSLHVDLRGQPSQHTRAAWVTLATTFFWQRCSVTVPCSWKVQVGKPHLHVKKFQQKKKKTDRPPVKIWAMLVEAETFLCLALSIFLFGLLWSEFLSDGFYFQVFSTGVHFAGRPFWSSRYVLSVGAKRHFDCWNVNHWMKFCCVGHKCWNAKLILHCSFWMLECEAYAVFVIKAGMSGLYCCCVPGLQDWLTTISIVFGKLFKM